MTARARLMPPPSASLTIGLFAARMNVLRFSDLVAAGKAAGQRVFIRADLNVPLDDAGRITEDTRIRASMPCIEMALDAGAAVMVTSHLGRPTEGAVQARGFAGAGGAPAGRAAGPRGAAGRRLGRRRRRRAGPGGAARELPRSTRARRRTTRRWRASWPRCATSSCTTPSAPPTAPRRRPTASRSSRRSPAPGRCWRPRSTRSRKALANPKRPLVAIVAGSKVTTKLTILQSLAKNVDQLIVGGGIANTFMLAAGLPIGKSLAEPDLLDEARR